MDFDRHERTRLLWPQSAIEALAGKTVLVAGLGGVGSWTVEALARAGTGRLILVDPDVISPSNLNRQLYALESTVGQAKCDLAARRVRDINRAIDVLCFRERLFPGAARGLRDRCPVVDYIVDAIDSVSAKVDLIASACHGGIPLISSMGTGNRRDPSRLRLAELSGIQGDPLARRVRQGLRKHGIEKVKVLCSEEPPVKMDGEPRQVGSVPTVAPVAGFLIASEVIADLVLRESAG
ncbi:MAG TPA: tRNA threonylcarbamoyladenosine dehydratase [Bacillota bacterium]|jgi:tRNA A37 threonylcarbamoyladenosine dehydratase|nr:tRNA threonylcarbamoyladenosine dehydratase [Fastidiosipila sp.]HPX93380.1 tRNA threonylcarbamoyladenosine dehydratase [Bacillota bacterium]HQB80482.1 tRNA threonylcarbamoyladenosine dehydratase [Bacillota bacterium]